MHEHVDAVVEAAADGIDFDGLWVEETDGGYALATPATDLSGLDEAGLRDLVAGSPYATNWYYWHAIAPQSAAEWAFLRWVEGADERPVRDRYEELSEGRTVEWGQVRVRATLDGGGRRRYALRHADDADADPAALESYEDPLDARDLAKYDDDGRYRPLKTAPTLRTGWHYPDLGPDDLVDAVDFLYPATVANWHREREGDLDVSHWRETMERQTGIYGLIETWDRGEGHEHVDWVAEACCVDSQCLKRREWQYDEETDLDVDGGDGQFPCREPCSVVISAARKWTRLESEQPRTYEFELTESEKAQIEAIVDAVADGRAGEIREADVYDGANRYRARFLRAKLFDEDGNLGGVRTEPEESDAATESDAE